MTTETKTRPRRAGRPAHAPDELRPTTAQPADASSIIAAAGEQAALYLRIQKARVAFSNEISALQRDGINEDVYGAGITEALALIAKDEDRIGRALGKTVDDIPVAADFAEAHRGVSTKGLGQVLGAFGDPRRFHSPSAMWKYGGLAVVDGRAPKRARGMDADDPRRHNPTAKIVIIHRVAAWAVVTGRKGVPTEYSKLYDDVRAEILRRPRVGPSGCPFGVEHQNFERATNAKGEHRMTTGSKKVVQCVREEEGKPVSGHVHAHCLRRVAKLILLQLWLAFNPEKAR